MSRKGHTATLKNGRDVRFNKRDQLDFFNSLVHGTPWEVNHIHEHNFKKCKEMKPLRDDLHGFLNF